MLLDSLAAGIPLQPNVSLYPQDRALQTSAYGQRTNKLTPGRDEVQLLHHGYRIRVEKMLLTFPTRELSAFSRTRVNPCPGSPRNSQAVSPPRGRCKRNPLAGVAIKPLLPMPLREIGFVPHICYYLRYTGILMLRTALAAL